MYGQTEATARMSYVPPKYLSEKIGSIGIARFITVHHICAVLVGCYLCQFTIAAGLCSHKFQLNGRIDIIIAFATTKSLQKD